MKPSGDIKDNYHEYEYCTEYVIGECAIPFCRRPITTISGHVEHVHSDDNLCSMRCAELHWAKRLTDNEK